MKKVFFLIGGFGNNLFQINKANFFYEKGVPIKLNTYLLNDNWITRKLGWSIHEKTLVNMVIDDYEVEEKMSFRYFLCLSVFMILKRTGFIDFRSFNSSFSIFGVMIGYWQDNVVLSDSLIGKLREKFYLKGKNKDNCLVIHARRGDYPESQRLSVSYYINALKMEDAKKITVVTDTPSFLDELKGEVNGEYEFVIPELSSVKDDFSLLVNSNKLIMSNSTFCYWASQIAPVSSVIYPSFFLPKLDWTFPLANKEVRAINNE